MKRFKQVNEESYNNKDWSSIRKMVFWLSQNVSGVEDIGTKNENTKKIGKKVHEFAIGNKLYQVIEVAE